MKVVYATSVPPGLQGPTRGELRIRVQSMIIQDSLVNSFSDGEAGISGGGPIAPHVPVDHCSIQFRFWGESAPRSSSAVMPRTSAHPDRPTYELVYTVKTLEPQLTQYLQHMTNSSQGGLLADIFVANDVTGKKHAVQVGRAVISLASLTPMTAISGWMNIVDFATKSRCIGRVQLHVSVAFFDPAAGSKRMQQQPRIDSSSKLPINQQEVAASATTQSAEQTKRDDKKAASEPEAIVKDTPTPAVQPGTAIVPKQQQPSKFSTQQAAADQYEEAAVGPNNSASKSHRDVLLRDIFDRGVVLRDMMAAASSPSRGDVLSSLPNLLSSRANAVLSSVDAALKKLPSNATPVFSFAEHLHSNAPVSAENDLNAVQEEGFEEDAVSASTASDDDDDDFDQKDQQHSDRRRQDFFRGRNGSAQAAEATNPLVIVPRDSTVHIALTNISFAPTSTPSSVDQGEISEIRFALRWSTDVLVSGLPLNTVSSYVRKLPLARDCTIHMQLDVRSYTSESKLVLECFSVRSEPRQQPPRTTLLPQPNPAPDERVIVSESLIGLAMIGVFAQSRDVFLHHPVTGANPLRMACNISILSDAAAAASAAEGVAVSESHDVAHAPRFDVPSYKQPPTTARKPDMEGGSSRRHRRGSHRGHHHCREESESSDSTATSSRSSSSSGDSESRHRRKPDASHIGISPAFAAAAPPHVVVFEQRGGSGGGSTVTITQHQPRAPPPQTLYKPPTTEPQGVEQKKAMRVHVSITEAKSLPHRLRFIPPAAPSQVDNSEVHQQYTWEQPPSAASDDDASGPTTFFTVEDFTLAAPALSPLLESSTLNNTSSKRALSLTGAVVEGWNIEAAVQGTDDKTQIIYNTSSPHYKYECIAALPSSPQLLGQLHLQLWGVQCNNKLNGATIAATNGTNSTSAGLNKPPEESHNNIGVHPKGGDTEQQDFWSSCAAVGRVVVDLTMLKFLPSVDGWHKILSTNHAVDTVIGHVRVAVRIL